MSHSLNHAPPRRWRLCRDRTTRWISGARPPEGFLDSYHDGDWGFAWNQTSCSVLGERRFPNGLISWYAGCFCRVMLLSQVPSSARQSRRDGAAASAGESGFQNELFHSAGICNDSRCDSEESRLTHTDSRCDSGESRPTRTDSRCASGESTPTHTDSRCHSGETTLTRTDSRCDSVESPLTRNDCRCDSGETTRTCTDSRCHSGETTLTRNDFRCHPVESPLTRTDCRYEKRLSISYPLILRAMHPEQTALRTRVSASLLPFLHAKLG